MSHLYFEREDELLHCKICGGAEASLPTHCPGERMTDVIEGMVQVNQMNFVNGKWWVPLTMLATEKP